MIGSLPSMKVTDLISLWLWMVIEISGVEYLLEEMESSLN